MKKISPYIIGLSLILAATFQIAIAAPAPTLSTIPQPITTTNPTATTTPATDPNATKTTTTAPTMDPNAASNFATWTGGAPASSGGTPIRTTTTPPTTTPVGIVPIVVTQPPKATTTPPRVIIPPKIPSTTTPPTENHPPADTTNCPTLAPLATQQQPCPNVVKQNIIPNLPWPIIVTPFLGVGLFWFVFSYLQKSNLRGEKHIEKIKSNSSHKQQIFSAQINSYQDAINFINNQLSSSKKLDLAGMQKIASHIQLVGSPKMQNLANLSVQAFASNNKEQVKILLKQMASQVRTEL